MKNLCYSLMLVMGLILAQSCNKAESYAQKIKTLDSLGGAMNSRILELQKVDTILLQKSINRFVYYKEFIELNIHDTLDKMEADQLFNFYASGKNLKNFQTNRALLLDRSALINTQLNKLAADLKSNSPDLELLEKFTGHEKQEIARLLDAAAAQQTIYHRGLEQFQTSLKGVELLIRKRNNGELPTIIKDTLSY